MAGGAAACVERDTSIGAGDVGWLGVWSVTFAPLDVEPDQDPYDLAGLETLCRFFHLKEASLRALAGQDGVVAGPGRAVGALVAIPRPTSANATTAR